MAFRRRMMKATGERLLHFTTITYDSEQPEITTYGKSTQGIDTGGFDAGADTYSWVTGFGSIANATYNDGNGISRTIESLYYIHDPGFPFDPPLKDRLQFVLDGNSLGITDALFTKIVVNGYTFLQGDAGYNPTVQTGTRYTWSGVDPFDAGLAGNPYDLEIWGK